MPLTTAQIDSEQSLIDEYQSLISLYNSLKYPIEEFFKSSQIAVNHIANFQKKAKKFTTLPNKKVEKLFEIFKRLQNITEKIDLVKTFEKERQRFLRKFELVKYDVDKDGKLTTLTEYDYEGPVKNVVVVTDINSQEEIIEDLQQAIDKIKLLVSFTEIIFLKLLTIIERPDFQKYMSLVCALTDWSGENNEILVDLDLPTKKVTNSNDFYLSTKRLTRRVVSSFNGDSPEENFSTSREENDVEGHKFTDIVGHLCMLSQKHELPLKEIAKELKKTSSIIFIKTSRKEKNLIDVVDDIIDRIIIAIQKFNFLAENRELFSKSARELPDTYVTLIKEVEKMPDSSMRLNGHESHRLMTERYKELNDEAIKKTGKAGHLENYRMSIYELELQLRIKLAFKEIEGAIKFLKLDISPEQKLEAFYIAVSALQLFSKKDKKEAASLIAELEQEAKNEYEKHYLAVVKNHFGLGSENEVRAQLERKFRVSQLLKDTAVLPEDWVKADILTLKVLAEDSVGERRSLFEAMDANNIDSGNSAFFSPEQLCILNNRAEAGHDRSLNNLGVYNSEIEDNPTVACVFFELAYYYARPDVERGVILENFKNDFKRANENMKKISDNLEKLRLQTVKKKALLTQRAEIIKIKIEIILPKLKTFNAAPRRSVLNLFTPRQEPTMEFHLEITRFLQEVSDLLSAGVILDLDKQYDLLNKEFNKLKKISQNSSENNGNKDVSVSILQPNQLEIEKIRSVEMFLKKWEKAPAGNASQFFPTDKNKKIIRTEFNDVCKLLGELAINPQLKKQCLNFVERLGKIALNGREKMWAKLCMNPLGMKPPPSNPSIEQGQS